MILRPCCIFSKTTPTLASILVTPNQAGHSGDANVLGAGMVDPPIALWATSFYTLNINNALSNLRFAWRWNAATPHWSPTNHNA